jgi:hypothetical protein
VSLKLYTEDFRGVISDEYIEAGEEILFIPKD